MDYQFEALGDERFQQLCQSLIAAEFPNATCYPVGMPDGGRDAVAGEGKNAQSIIFQVKYVRDPSTKEAREAVLSAIKSEAEKVKRLKARGAVAYYLITNVGGTSHLNSGSMDKAQDLLSAEFDLPAYCWWRSDIEARLNIHSQIKWSFIELIKGGDILARLVSAESKAEVDARRTVESYVSLQWVRDSQLKFKQVDLENAILRLFTDVPVRISGASSEGGGWASFRAQLEQYGIPWSHEFDVSSSQRRIIVGAMRMLVNSGFSNDHDCVVLEGAPGQGKSTVSQYLCQVHRLLLLNKESDLRLVSQDCIPIDLRIPFRIDIRDYATWLQGKNPFSENYSDPLPPETSLVLEKFIVAQVSRFTGASFSVEDLRWISSNSKILIVLDGFDEVADVGVRKRIVAEVNEAAVRMKHGSLSCQIIVTSRPTAFANSPGFPRDKWEYMELLPLSRESMMSYAERWLDARGADPREVREMKNALRESLVHAHVRDLAKNPMQLSILLALMNAQGTSLPNKRTALYDKYIDVFLNRESEKSEIIRHRRDLILQIHGYMAWVLQVDAENKGAGNIKSDELRTVVRQYLENRGYEMDALDDLFLGVTERVVALVSRVQGTYEFEVQPLREYFAARYIYDSAPYVTAALDSGGTKPDRLRALTGNFFWRNVARFYAGCYTSGELASLVEGIRDLDDDKSFSGCAYSLRLGFEFLTDYVFSSQPRLAENMVDPLSDRDLLAIFASILSIYSARTHIVPEGAARKRFSAVLLDFLAANSAPAYRTLVLRMLAENSTPDELVVILNSLSRNSCEAIETSNILALGMIGEGSCEFLSSVKVDNEKQYARSLFASSRFDVIDQREGWIDSMLSIMTTQPYPLFPHYDLIPRSHDAIRVLKFASVFANYKLFGLTQNLDIPMSDYLMPYLEGPDDEDELRAGFHGLCPLDSSGRSWSAFDSVYARVFYMSSGELKSDQDLITEIIDVGGSMFGECFAVNRLAYAFSKLMTVETVAVDRIFDASMSSLEMCRRIAFHNGRGGWLDVLQALDDAECPADRLWLALAASINAMSLAEILTGASVLARIMERLSYDDFQYLCALIEDDSDTELMTEPDIVAQVEQVRAVADEISARLAICLKSRLSSLAYTEVWRRSLSSVVTDDSSMAMEVVSVWIRVAQLEPELWGEAIESARRNASCISAYIYIDETVSSAPSIPEVLARRVLCDPYSYPPAVVALCVSSMDGFIGGRSLSVSSLARVQGWIN